MVNYDARDLGLTVVGSSGKNQQLRCPFHEDKHPSASFDHERGLFFCFSCRKGMNYRQLAEALELDGVFLPEDKIDDPTSFVLDLYTASPDDHVNYSHTCTDEVRAYMNRRGLEDNFIDRMHYELFLSSVTYPRHAVAFQQDYGNVIRWVEPRGFNRYSLDGLKSAYWPEFPTSMLRTDGPIFCFEGNFSALKALQSKSDVGHPYQVCSMQGSNIVEDTLLYAVPHMIFVLDNDRAGQKAAARLKSEGYIAYVASSPIDDLTKGGVTKWIRNALKVVKTRKLLSV